MNKCICLLLFLLVHNMASVVVLQRAEEEEEEEEVVIEENPQEEEEEDVSLDELQDRFTELNRQDEQDRALGATREELRALEQSYELQRAEMKSLLQRKLLEMDEERVRERTEHNEEIETLRQSHREEMRRLEEAGAREREDQQAHAEKVIAELRLQLESLERARASEQERQSLRMENAIGELRARIKELNDARIQDEVERVNELESARRELTQRHEARVKQVREQHRQEVSNLTASVSHLQQHVTAMETTVAETERQLAATRAELIERSTELQAARHVVSTSTTTAEEKEHVVNELRLKLSQMQGTENAMRAQLESLAQTEEELQQMQRTLQEKADEASLLRDKLRTAEGKARELSLSQKTLHEEKLQTATLREELQQLNTKYDMLLNRSFEINTTLEQLRTEHATLQRVQEDTEKRLQKTDAAHTTLMSAHAKLEAEHGNLRVQHATTTAQLESTREDLEQTREQLLASRSEKVQQQGTINSLHAVAEEVKTLREDLQYTTQQLQEAREAVHVAERELVQAQQQLSEEKLAGKANAAALEQIPALEAQLQEATQQVQELNQRAFASRTELSQSYEARLAEVKQQLVNTEAKLATVEREHESRLSAITDTSSHQLQMLRDELEDTQSVVTMSRENLDREMAVSARLREQTNTLREQLETLQTEKHTWTQQTQLAVQQASATQQQLAEDLATAQETLRVTQHKLKETESQVRAKDGENSRLTAILDSSRQDSAQMQQLTAELAETQQKYETLVVQAEKTRQEYETFKEQATDRRAMLDAMLTQETDAEQQALSAHLLDTMLQTRGPFYQKVLTHTQSLIHKQQQGRRVKMVALGTLTSQDKLANMARREVDEKTQLEEEHFLCVPLPAQVESRYALSEEQLAQATEHLHNTPLAPLCRMLGVMQEYTKHRYDQVEVPILCALQEHEAGMVVRHHLGTAVEQHNLNISVDRGTSFKDILVTSILHGHGAQKAAFPNHSTEHFVLCSFSAEQLHALCEVVRRDAWPLMRLMEDSTLHVWVWAMHRSGTGYDVLSAVKKLRKLHRRCVVHTLTETHSCSLPSQWQKQRCELEIHADTMKELTRALLCAHLATFATHPEYVHGLTISELQKLIHDAFVASE